MLLVCFALAVGASADTRTIPSTDRIPTGDWTYDAMAHLAARGLVPGFAARVFEGDEVFNRIEMAQVVASVIKFADGKKVGIDEHALIDKLVQDLAPELRYVDPGIVDLWAKNVAPVPSGETFLMGYIQSKFDADKYENSETVIPYRVSGFSNLATQVFVMGTLADKEEKFYHSPRTGPPLDKAFIRGTDSNFTWSAGSEYFNWGPAYTGSLILSDNSLAFTQIHISKEINFGKLFGRVKVTELVSEFSYYGLTFWDHFYNLGDVRCYFFGRRYEKSLSHNWHLGISETAKMNTAPDPSILVVPVYVYELLHNSDDANFNAVYALDLSYLAKNGNEFYGEFLVDDMTAPKWLPHDVWYPRPNKTGYILGFYSPKVFNQERRTTFRAEYIYIRPETYSATREEVPELAYTHGNYVIGSPIGSGSNALYLRGERYLSDKMSATIDYLHQFQMYPSFGYGTASRCMLSIQLSYDIAPDKSVSMRVSPCRFNGSYMRWDDTQYEVKASYAF